MQWPQLKTSQLRYKSTIGLYDIYEYIGEDFSRLDNFPEWKPGNRFAYNGQVRKPTLKEIFLNEDGHPCKNNIGDYDYGTRTILHFWTEPDAPESYYIELVEGL